MKTAYSKIVIPVLVITFAFLLIWGCERGNESNTAIIKIKAPSEFLNNNRAVGPAAVTGKPADINRIIISVNSPAGELGSGDILQAGGSLAFEVPAFTKLTVSGFAYASQALRYRGSTSVGPLEPGTQNPISLTLNPVDGIGGSIIIDGIVPTSGTVSLFEVDSAGNPVGAARASAAVENGEFVIEIPPAIIPSSHYVIRTEIDGMAIESRYTDSGTIEVSAVTHATSRLVSELAAMAENGLDAISVQEIKEIQQTLQNIKNLKTPFVPNGEITIEDYAQELIDTLKSDIQTSAIATSAIRNNEICGQVMDNTNSPVQGIQIVAHDFASSALMSRTTTGPNGNYCLNVPTQGETDPFSQFQSSGEFVIGAIDRTRSANNAPNASVWWTQDGGTNTRIDASKLTFGDATQVTADFALPQGARIQGFVTGQTEANPQPLPGISVIVREKTTQYFVAVATTDASGNYVVNVSPGEYIIEARNNTTQAFASETHSSGGGSNNRNLGEIVTLAANDNFTANFELQPGTELSGSITEDSNPVVGTRVFVNNDEGGAATRMRVTKTDGSFNVWLRSDAYEVFAYGQSQLADLTNGSLPNPIDFSASVAKLPVVVQHEGIGISKVKTRLYVDNDGSFQLKSTDFSKQDGTLTLYSDQSGSHVVIATVEGEEPYASIVYADQSQRQSGTSVPLTLGQMEQQLLVNSPQAGLLSGVVTSDGTTPIANVNVVVRQGGTDVNNFFVSTRTRGDGSYKLSLPGGITYDAIRFVSSDNSFDPFNCDMILISNGSTMQLDVDTSAQPPCIRNGNPINNSPPTADAGIDRTVSVNTTVTLDGSNSSDIDQDPLSYSWSVTSPQGNDVTLTYPAEPGIANFTPDQIGDYIVQLIVNDGELDSAPVTVTISAINDSPVADAGADQTVTVFRTATLDASGSSDPNNDDLTYSWSFVSGPSNVTLSDPSAANPTFVPDSLGAYVWQLIVNDGLVDSEPSTVTITAEPATVNLQLLNTTLVGVNRSAQLGVTLTDPAPVGGITVSISSDNNNILSVTQPSTVFIAEGESNGEITVNGVAAGTTTLHAVATGYVEGTLDVDVTLNLISIPTSLNIPLGQTVNLPVTIAPNPAPAGGIVVELISSDPSIGQLETTSVTIAEGTRSANVQITGLLPGSVTINASNPNYASDSGQASVTAAFNITQTSLTFNRDFPQDITIQLQSDSQNISAPQPLPVAVTSDDSSCVAANSPVTIDTGFVSTTTNVSYGGSAELPCSATITLSAPNITSATLNVTINPPFALQFNYSTINIGAGLQNYQSYRVLQVNLGASNHGGVTIRIQSSDPNLALVAPDYDTAGSGYIDVFVPNGQQYARYVAQGMNDVTGTVTFTASGTGFDDGTSTVNIVQPALLITGVSPNTTSFSADSPFRVGVGLPSTNNSSIAEYQTVRAGGPPLVATIMSSDTNAGQLVTSIATGGAVDIEIAPGSVYSAYSVDTGGVAFDPVNSGTTTISATIPGFIATTAASADVTVSSPTLQFNYPSVTIGSGLQNHPSYRQLQINLGATNHGGVTVRIQSSNPSLALVAPDYTTAGSEFIDVQVADGQQIANYVAQGVEDVTGTATFTASAPGFNDGTGEVIISQPALLITGLTTTTTSFTADLPFRVGVGLPSLNNTSLSELQSVRAGGGSLTATLISSNPTVGQLATTAATGDTVTVDIEPGQPYTPYSVSNGGVAFDSLSSGTTSVTASIPGFIATNAATVDISVTQPQLQFSYSSTTVGSGLQTTSYNTQRYVNLGATDHGGVTLHIQSSNSQLALVAPDINTPGAESIDIEVPDGQQFVYYITQGVEGAIGTTTFTASAPGFTDGTTTVEVVQPALLITGLSTSTTTLSANSTIRVATGIPVSTNSGLSEYQAVRAGSNPLIATLMSSDANVGQMVTNEITGNTVTVNIQPGEFYSPVDVASGGVAFDPLTSGSTTVNATIPGFIATTQAMVDVSVTAPQLQFYYANTNVGAGLQTTYYNNYRYVNLGATDHGGVTIRIQSSNPSVALVAPNTNTPGTEYIDVDVADGQQYANYVAQGVEGAAGSVTFTASAPGFTNGTSTVNVVQPALIISGLSATVAPDSQNIPFLVGVGIPSTNNSSLAEYQSVRAGGNSLTATVINSNASVGQLTTTATSGSSVTVMIDPGQIYSPNTVANGGVEFDPLASGTTSISATIPDFIATTQATVNVTVTP